MICLLGIAGSGKSTQAELLSQSLNCPRVYPGEILRQHATGKARQQVEAGELVDDSVTIPLLEAELKRRDAKSKECVMDGAPRSMDQAKWLAELVEAGQVKFGVVIHLLLDKTVALERLKQRGRDDDLNASIIDQRFKEYEDRMGPVINYLKQHGLKVVDVDASPSIEEIQQDIRRVVDAA